MNIPIIFFYIYHSNKCHSTKIGWRLPYNFTWMDENGVVAVCKFNLQGNFCVAHDDFSVKKTKELS